MERLVQPGRLAIARLEPILSARHEAVLDLTFERDGNFGTIAFVLVDAAFLVLRESSPFCWPAALRDAVDPRILRDLESLVEPWLKSRTMARFENEECSRFFRDEPAIRCAYERACDLHLLGAAPLARVARSIAPHVYAYRFAAGKRVAVCGAKSGSGAALLYGRSASVAFDSGDAETDEFVRQWFSFVELDGVRREIEYDVLVSESAAGAAAATVLCAEAHAPGGREIPVARSLPLSLMVSFDPEDSMQAGAFSVRSALRRTPRRSSLVVPAALGGSSGRIGIVAREDWERAPDCDTDAVRAMQRRLKAEGFTPSVVDSPGRLDPADFDLVHVVGTAQAPAMRPVLDRLRQANVPIVVTPYLDDPKGEADWGGQITTYAFRGSFDDTIATDYLRALALRRLGAPGVLHYDQIGTKPNESVAALVAAAGAILASCPQEARFIRERYGYGGRIVPAPTLLEHFEARDVTPLAGDGDFILFHGPISGRSNLLLLMTAAAAQRHPLVVTGPIENSEIYGHFTSFAGELTRYIPSSQCSPEEVEGLYARARVYADVSWSGRGVGRLARAGSYGAALVCSANGYGKHVWDDLAFEADPGNVGNIADALARAWEAAPSNAERMAVRTAQLFDQAAGLQGAALAYQQAAQTCAAP
jgi:hypothetical protein